MLDITFYLHVNMRNICDPKISSILNYKMKTNIKVIFWLHEPLRSHLFLKGRKQKETEICNAISTTLYCIMLVILYNLLSLVTKPCSDKYI